jgi:predicted dehydrogenase
VLRAGVVGCGFQGRAHVAELAAIEGVEVVAIADLDARRLEVVGDAFGVAHRHRDADELIRRELDLITICTMPHTHRELVVRALDHGAHVFCEKPLAMNAAEGAEMVRAADAADRLLMVGFNMRFMGATAAVRGFMQEGLLGDPVCARGFMLADDVPWWGRHYERSVSGGGALASSAVHMLDLLIWLAGAPRPVSASASMTAVFPRKRAAGAPSAQARAAFDVEDVVFGHVRFADGFWLSIEGAWIYDRPGWNYSFDLLGTRGQAHLQPLELYTERNGVVTRVWEDAPTQPDFAGALRDELRAVVDSVRDGRMSDRLASGRQALAVQAVTDALYRSARAGREVPVEQMEHALA